MISAAYAKAVWKMIESAVVLAAGLGSCLYVIQHSLKGARGSMLDSQQLSGQAIFMTVGLAAILIGLANSFGALLSFGVLAKGNKGSLGNHESGVQSESSTKAIDE